MVMQKGMLRPGSKRASGMRGSSGKERTTVRPEARGPGRSRTKAAARSADVERMAITVSAGTKAAVQAAANAEAGGNVSAWMEEAAAAKLRLRAARELLAAYEAENGEISDEEMGQARARWQRG
jgi:hypothetical protein